MPDRLDLSDIVFASGPTVDFTPAVGSGTLSISDGTRTANLTLLGTYTTANFHLASDGHGGTLVTDPPSTGSPSGASATFDFADLSASPRDPGHPAAASFDGSATPSGIPLAALLASTLPLPIGFDNGPLHAAGSS